MNSSLRHKITALVLCICLLLFPRPARADSLQNAAIGAGIAIAAVGAAIGIGIYFLVRRAPSVTGCVATGPGGLTLQNENDQKTFSLIGDTTSIKPGDRIHVSGKPDFLVEKLVKDYGPCKVPS